MSSATPGAKGRRQRRAPGPIDIATARVLHRILTGSRNERTREHLDSPHETDAAQGLIAAGLIERCRTAIQAAPRCDATFGFTARPEPPRPGALYGH